MRGLSAIASDARVRAATARGFEAARRDEETFIKAANVARHIAELYDLIAALADATCERCNRNGNG